MWKKTLRKIAPHLAAFPAVLIAACGADSPPTSGSGGGPGSGGNGGSPSTAGAGGMKGGASGQASGASGVGVAGGGASGSSAGTGGSTSAAACSAWAAAACDQQKTCDQTAWLRDHGSKSACEQREQALCQKALSLTDTHATSGQVVDCTKTSPLTCGERCSALLSPGQLLAGDPCSHSWQCASLLCAKNLAGGCGVCSGDRPAGALCKIDSECDEGLGCYEGACTARAPEGASCLAQPCALGLSCVGFSPIRVCKPRASLGEPCDPSGYGAADCAEGYCTDGTCHAPSLVQPGKPCGITNSVLCTGGFCDGSTCRGWAKEGDTCSTSLICGPGSVCIVPSEKCVLAPSCGL
jgi:hypothetical protein